MNTKTVTDIVQLGDDYTRDGVKRRMSGNGSFLAPMKKDIGRAVVLTRACRTWNGSLGYFMDDPEKDSYAFAASEVRKLQEVVPMSEWGKDHWSLLAYVEYLCVNSGDHKGVIGNERLRGNPTRHPELCTSWQKRETPQPYPYGTRLKKGSIDWHDDWDCLFDLEMTGLVATENFLDYKYKSSLHSAAKGVTVVITEKGMEIASELNKHKAKGNQYKTFRYKQCRDTGDT
jgi:hypothetical protein